MQLKVRLTVAIGTVALLLGAFVGPSVAQAGASGSARTSPEIRPGQGILLGNQHLPAVVSPAAATRTPLLSQGYLVPNQAAYARNKVALNARSAQSRGLASKPRSLGVVSTPELGAVQAWPGLGNNGGTPSDSTGAIGPTRYIEIVNTRVRMYTRAGVGIGVAATMQSLMGDPHRPVSDPQIMWDPATNRWYYSAIDITKAVTGQSFNVLLFGWSKAATPAALSSKSWCQFGVYYGGTGASNVLPDYPKLGDTSNFLLIGHNDFNAKGTGYLGGSVTWIAKPKNGVTTCPTKSFPKNGVHFTKTPGGGSYAWTPEPVKQTDGSGTGYVLATDDVGGGGSSSVIYEYTVTRNSAGNAVFTAPASITVPAYSAPPAAAQPGTADMLDTLDGRLFQTVSSSNPSTGGPQVWTENTVLDTTPGFSAVRWYELNPVSHTETSTGLIDDGSHFFYNAAVSPDRRRSGTTGIYGDSAVIGFNTSSSTDYVAVQEESVGPFGTAGPQLIAQNSDAEEDDFCGLDVPNVCRWGDYSGATPDPASPANAAHGVVYLSNMLVGPTAGANNVQWTTENWAATPNFDAAMTGPASILQKNLASVPAWAQVGTYTGTSPTPHFSTQVDVAPYNGAFAGPVADETNTANTSGTNQTIAEGNTYCFTAAVVDNSVVTWEASRQRCMATPVDDRTLTRSTGWTLKTGTGWFDGTYLSAMGTGHSVSLPAVQAMRVGVLVGKCGTCGSIKVYLGATLLKTVSLHAASLQKDVLIPIATFTSVRTGTMKIVTATAGKPDYIDGVVTSHA